MAGPGFWVAEADRGFRPVTIGLRAAAIVAAHRAQNHPNPPPGQRPRVAERVLSGLPGQSHARACLLDHAAELGDALGELLEDEEVSVELAEVTLGRAAGVGSREHD